MCAAYRSAPDTEGDLSARLDAIEERVAELRDLFGGTAGRTIEDRVTAIERLLVRLEAGLSAGPRLAPQAELDLAPLEARLRSIEDTFAAAIGRLAEQVDRLHARIEASDASATVRELQERIEALARTEDLAALAEAVRHLPDGGAVAAIESRLGELASADAVAAVTDHLERLDLGSPFTALTDRVDELGDRIARRDDLAALRKQVSELARSEDLAALVERLERPLSVEGIQGVEDRIDLVLAEVRERTGEELQVDLQRLRDVVGRLARAEDIEALIELVAGIDGRTQSVASAHDLAAVRERVGDLQRGLDQLDVTEPVLAIREELDRVTTTVLEARRDVAQLAAGDVSELRERVATLASSTELELARADVTELGGAIRTLKSTIGRLGGVDETLSALRERVEGLESLVEDRAKTIVDPLNDLHDLVTSRTDALLQPGRIQAALAPMWEGIAGIAEDFAVAREAAQGQQQVIDGLGEVVERVERVASELRARVEGEEEALTGVVKEGVASELHEVVDEVRKLGASYHRVATDLGEQVQRLRRTSDEVVGALQRRDRLIQDEVVERLVTALDRVVELGGRSRRKVSKALADAAADGAAKAGDWEHPLPDAGPTRVTLRLEDDEETTEPG